MIFQLSFDVAGREKEEATAASTIWIFHQNIASDVICIIATRRMIIMKKKLITLLILKYGRLVNVPFVLASVLILLDLLG